MSLFARWIPGWDALPVGTWQQAHFLHFLNIAQDDDDAFRCLEFSLHSALTNWQNTFPRPPQDSPEAAFRYIWRELHRVEGRFQVTRGDDGTQQQVTVSEVLSFKLREDNEWQPGSRPGATPLKYMQTVWLQRFQDYINNKNGKNVAAEDKDVEMIDPPVDPRLAQSPGKTPSQELPTQHPRDTLSHQLPQPTHLGPVSDPFVDCNQRTTDFSEMLFHIIEQGHSYKAVFVPIADCVEGGVLPARFADVFLQFDMFMSKLDSQIKFNSNTSVLVCRRSGTVILNELLFRTNAFKQYKAGWKWICLSIAPKQDQALEQMQYALRTRLPTPASPVMSKRLHEQRVRELEEKIEQLRLASQSKPDTPMTNTGESSQSRPVNSVPDIMELDEPALSEENSILVPDVLADFWWWDDSAPIHHDIPTRPEQPRILKNKISSETWNELSDIEQRRVEQAWYKAAATYWQTNFPRMQIGALPTAGRDLARLDMETKLPLDSILKKAKVGVAEIKVNKTFSHDGTPKESETAEKSGDDYLDMAGAGEGEGQELFDAFTGGRGGDQFSIKLWKMACEFADFDYRCRLPRASIKIPGMRYGLYAYQLYAAFWMIHQASSTALTGLLLADSTGFGKSVIMAAVAVILRWYFLARFGVESHLEACNEQKTEPENHLADDDESSECPLDKASRIPGTGQKNCRYRFFFQCPCVKTSIAAKLARLQPGPILYIVPPSLVYNTADEIQKHILFEGGDVDDPDMRMLFAYHLTATRAVEMGWKRVTPANRYKDVYDNIVSTRDDEGYLLPQYNSSRFIIITTPQSLEGNVFDVFHGQGWVEPGTTRSKRGAVKPTNYPAFVPGWIHWDEWHNDHARNNSLLSSLFPRFECFNLTATSATPFTRSPTDLVALFQMLDTMRKPVKMGTLEEKPKDLIPFYDSELDPPGKHILTRQEITPANKNQVEYFLGLTYAEVQSCRNPTPEEFQQAAIKIDKAIDRKAKLITATSDQQKEFEDADALLKQSCSMHIIRRHSSSDWFGQGAVPIPPHTHEDVYLDMPADPKVVKAMNNAIASALAHRKACIEKDIATWQKKMDNYKQKKATNPPDGKEPNLNELGKKSWLRDMNNSEIFSIFPYLAVLLEEGKLNAAKGDNPLSAEEGKRINREGRKNYIWKNYRNDIFKHSPKLHALAATLHEIRKRKDWNGNAEKVIIFTRHTFADALLHLYVEQMFNYTTGHVHVDLDVASGARQQVVHRFNEEWNTIADDDKPKDKDGKTKKLNYFDSAITGLQEEDTEAAAKKTMAYYEHYMANNSLPEEAKHERGPAVLMGTFQMLGSGLSPTRAFRCIMMDVPNDALAVIQGNGRVSRMKSSQLNPMTRTIRFVLKGYGVEEGLLNKSIAGVESFEKACEKYGVGDLVVGAGGKAGN